MMSRNNMKTESEEPASASGKARKGAVGFATRSVFNRDRFAIFRFGAEQVGSARDRAWDAVRPQPFSRQEVKDGFRGRYPDGGAARFRELMGEHEVDAPHLNAIERYHVNTSRTFLAMGVFSLLSAFAIMKISDLMPIILGGAGLGLCSLTMLVMAIKFDFTAWQVRNRRIAGFQEYMENRSKRPGSGIASTGAPQPPRRV